MEDEYLNLVRLLNEANVEYVVLGGHAVIAHGYYRTTGEFEVADFTLVPNFLSFSRYDGWIDLMTFTVGVTFDECYQNRIELELDGTKIKFINLPELIKNKIALGRPQDLQDLENLMGNV